MRHPALERFRRLPADERSRLIEMAWEDRTPLETIETQFGLSEADTVAIMRRALKPAAFRRWREPSRYQLSRLNSRIHRKLLVVDGEVGFTGGANVADAWQGSPEIGGYRDLHYRSVHDADRPMVVVGASGTSTR